MFTDKAGKLIPPTTLREGIFAPLLRAAGLRHITPHDLRHGHASLMIQAGKELHFIQSQLGHHSPAFTLAVYGHLLPKDRRSEVNCLDDDATIRNQDATSPIPAVGRKGCKAA